MDEDDETRQLQILLLLLVSMCTWLQLEQIRNRVAAIRCVGSMHTFAVPGLTCHWH